MNIQSTLRSSIALSSVALLLFSPAASSQSFNIDFGDNVTLGIPSSTYGAASGQAGVWNDCIGDMPLADLAGNPTGVTIALVGVDTPYGFDELCTAGEDEMLLDDIMYTGGTTGYFLLTGLADGSYEVYTYAKAPDSNVFFTDVTIAGSAEGTLTVGGDFCAGFIHLATHAVHHVDVVGGNAQIDVAVNAEYTSMNGMQIIQTGGGAVGTAYCFGDAASCPCGNAGSAESGCANGSSVGAVITSSGSASISADDLVLSSTGLIGNQPGLYFQGNNAVGGGGLGIPFGDGLRCAGGGVIRLQVRFADVNGGSATNLSVATKGGCVAGDVKRYQIWYRDPATTPCGSQFNLSNGYEITWGA
jgi:hypothetical protein